MAAEDSARLDSAAACCDASASHDTGLHETQALEVFGFEEFLQHIGVDSRADARSPVMAAACHMFSAPLPPEWSECRDEGTAAAFFYNRLTGESRWAHPQQETFRELAREVGCWSAEDSLEHLLARSEAHLRGARGRLLEALAHWSGPHEASPEGGPAAQYFFNAATGESHWLDPRLAMEFDLMQRHDVLRECLAEHLEELSGGEWGCSSDEEGPSPRAPWPGAESPCSPARRAARAREAGARGDESVRSCATYLSACSDAGRVEDLGGPGGLGLGLGMGLGLGLGVRGPACLSVA